MVLRRTFLTGIVLTAGAFAQLSSFPKPNYFREVLKQSSTKVELLDPVRLKDFVVGDKLELSLKNYLELVMANNTDVQVSFLSLETSKNGIVSAQGVWDPSAHVSFSATRSISDPTDPTLAPSARHSTQTLSQPASLSYTQSLDTGTSYSATFGGSKSSGDVSGNFKPALRANMSFQVTQPLLRGRGRYINRIPVMQAQNRFRGSQFSLRSTLLRLVSDAENAYWSVISAREGLNVQIKAREATKSNYDFVKKQLDLGAISELDIYNPQGQLAQADLSVSQAQFRLASALDALRRQIGVDLDPDIRKLAIELTEPVDLGPAESLPLDPEQEVQKALANNPSLKSAMVALETDDLSIYSAKDGLRPQLSFSATYSTSGAGGMYYPTSGFGDTLVTGPVVPGGLGDALGGMFGLNSPSYVGSVDLRLPIRSKTASMAYANSLVSKKNDALSLRSQQQNIRLQVLNAVTNLQGSIEQLKLARIQADLQDLNLKAESKKFELGTETNQFVVNAIQSKVQADATVVTTQVSVRTNLLALLFATGTLLDERGIIVQP